MVLTEVGDALTGFFSHITELPLMEAVLIQLFVVFLIARIFSELFVRFGMLSQVGEIVAGILIANLAIGGFTLASGLDIAWDPVNPSVYHEVFEVIANLGVIFLLFSVGMETKFCDLKAVGKTSFTVASLGVVIPFIFGFGLIVLFDSFVTHDPNWLVHALFMAAAMVATCIGMTARVLNEIGVMHTIEAKIIVGAAVVDDILTMIVLAIVVSVAASQKTGAGIDLLGMVASIVVAVLFVVFIMLLCSHAIPKATERQVCRMTERGIRCQDREWPWEVDPFPLAIVTCLGLSAVAMVLGLASIIGAFLAGMLFAEFAHGNLEKRFRGINAFMVPLFFVYVGMRVHLAGFEDMILLTVCVIILAIIGKYVAGYIGVVKTDKTLGKEEGKIVGIGMAPRGEVGITVAYIGLAAAAITQEMYTVVVFMSIVTALLAPPWMAKAFKKKYKDRTVATGHLVEE